MTLQQQIKAILGNVPEWAKHPIIIPQEMMDIAVPYEFPRSKGKKKRPKPC